MAHRRALEHRRIERRRRAEHRPRQPAVRPGPRGRHRRRQPYNPTTDPVDFAFAPIGARPTTWYPGGWDGTAAIPGSNAYRAHVLIGPGSTGPTLAPGRYAVWLRITDDPEQPVINIGQLFVT
ncbi:hypothetical protein ACFQ3Z_16065 [Streptomyces nogalater]